MVIRYIKIFINSLLSIVLLLMFFVPYGTSFCPGCESTPGQEWINSYIYDNIELVIIYLPLCALWTIGLLTKKKWVEYCLLANAILVSMYSFATLIFPLQDFFSGIGALLCTIIFPLVLIKLMFNWKASRLKQHLAK